MEIEAVGWAMGHRLYYKNDKWFLSETNEEYNKISKKIKCVICGDIETEKGHDPCISNLKDVKYACCGHGIIDEEFGTKQSYIKFNNGEVMRFDSTDDLLDYVEEEGLKPI